MAVDPLEQVVSRIEQDLNVIVGLIQETDVVIDDAAVSQQAVVLSTEWRYTKI